jgi:hypothetical protein
MDEVWNQRPWSFKWKSTTVVLAAGSGTLPTDFCKFGQEGLVWENSAHKVYTETTPQELMALRAEGDSSRRLFSVLSVNGTTPKLVVSNATSTVTLSLFYETNPPTLADSSTEIAGLPVAYHGTVLLAGTAATTQMAKNDERVYWEKKYVQGLARLIANDLPLQSRIRQLPMSTGKPMW